MSEPDRAEWAPGIRHASLDGYPACGAEQRPANARERFPGDVVAGLGDVDCAACLEVGAK